MPCFINLSEKTQRKRLETLKEIGTQKGLQVSQDQITKCSLNNI
jgi:hypothetical protein